MAKEQAFDIVLQEFLKIAEIPRPSHHEERIAKYLYGWAQQHGLAVEQDSLGNIIIDKPATPGCENVPRVLFQAHMDMVCIAAEGVSYDPMTDPIKVINDGKTLRADGTSLGADDGIGVAMALCLLQDESLRHGPIRAIFTTNEEDGMDSVQMEAKYLDGEFLINLDWETIGSLCNSCAGGDYFNFSHDADWEPVPEGYKGLTIHLGGLLGGHSGVGINKGHANAIVSIATALSTLRREGISFRVSAFSGGRAKNAIPANAKAEIAIPAKDCLKAQKLLQAFEKEFRNAFGSIEPNIEFQVSTEDQAPIRVLGENTGYGLIDLMTVVPNNVHTMSPFIDGLVESSSNLGLMDLSEERIHFTVFARSSVAYQASQLGLICNALARGFGYAFDADGHVPGWAVNPNSKLVPIACEVYKKLTGKDMIVEPVHAAVECGAFAEKNPKLDMIAIGPTLLDVHSPAESCSLEDIRITIDLLIGILEHIAQ